jgi:flagellar motor switch protein FliN/FliY
MNENTTGQNNTTLTDLQKDTLGEIGNICMSSAATALHDILSRMVTITTPNVSITSIDELTGEYNIPYVVIDVSYTQGVLGSNLLVIKTQDVKLITSILLGEEEAGLEEELSELHLSAIGEVMNQMMGASATSLATLIAKEINISPPNISVINISEDKSKIPFHDDLIISTKFKMEVENLLKTEILLLMPLYFGKDLVNGFLEHNNIDDNTTPEKETAQSQQIPAAEKHISGAKNTSDNLIKQTDEKQTNVKNIKLRSFDAEDSVKNQTNNMDILMDVPLTVKVELGRTKRYLKDILELNLGSIIALEKSAGELVDVLVNGKLIARGEVVVIDDNFGVRITDIVTSNIMSGYPK